MSIRRLFSFFEKQHQTPSGQASPECVLNTFLTQCHTQNVHIVFKGAKQAQSLDRVIAPLNASRQARHHLLNKLTPMTTFTLSPETFYTAMNHHGQQAFPCQVCDQCAPSLVDFYCQNERLVDAGWCSQCHQKGDCLDVPLIEHYRKHHIDDETIWLHLPRTRWASRYTCIPPLYQSIEEIEKTYAWVFEAAAVNSPR